MPIRIVLLDDHPLVLKGLEQLLQSGPDFEVVAVESTETTDRISIRQHSTGEVVTVTSYFETPDRGCGEA